MSFGSYEAASINSYTSQSNNRSLLQTTSLFAIRNPQSFLGAPQELFLHRRSSFARIYRLNVSTVTATFSYDHTHGDHRQRSDATRDYSACRLATRPNSICTTIEIEHLHRRHILLRLPLRDVSSTLR